MTAFLNGIGSVVCGAYASARLSLSVPSDLDVLNAIAIWELLDAEGRIWTHGETTELSSIASQVALNNKTITAEIEVAIPSNLPCNDAGSTYQIRWSIKLQSGQTLYSFESFQVMPAHEQAQGASDAIELNGDVAVVQIRLPVKYKYVEYQCFRGNSIISNQRAATAAQEGADGYTYLGALRPDEYILPSLDPITVIWSYWNEEGAKQRETTQLFIANPIILDAVKDMQTWLNRAYTDSGMQPGTTFTATDFVKYLRVGRDEFNASDKPTEFSMIAAAGPIRWFWIGYSCVAAARAQYLAEGMKAFNYSGQVVQLDIDRTPFWDSVAQNMEQRLGEQIKPFKDNLVKKGILGGDGSSMAMRPGAVGAIGITIHGLSPVRGLYGLGSPLTPYQR